MDKETQSEGCLSMGNGQRKVMLIPIPKADVAQITLVIPRYAIFETIRIKWVSEANIHTYQKTNWLEPPAFDCPL